METTVVSYGVHTHNVQQQQKQIMEEMLILRRDASRVLCGWWRKGGGGAKPNEWGMPVQPSIPKMPPPQ